MGQFFRPLKNAIYGRQLSVLGFDLLTRIILLQFKGDLLMFL